MFAGQRIEELQQRFAASAFVKETITAHDFDGGFQCLTETALRGIGLGQFKARCVVIRIGLKTGFQRRGIGRTLCQCQSGTQGIGAIRFVGVVTGQQLCRFVAAPQLQQYIDGVELNSLILQIGLTGFNQFGKGFVEFAVCDQGGGFFSQVASRPCRQGNAVEKFTDLAFGQGAVEFIDQLALINHLH